LNFCFEKFVFAVTLLTHQKSEVLFKTVVLLTQVCFYFSDVMLALLMKGRSPMCGMMTLVECPCLSGRRFEDRREQFLKVLQLFQAVQLQLVSMNGSWFMID